MRLIKKGNKKKNVIYDLMTDFDQKHTSNEQITVHILRIKPRH